MAVARDEMFQDATIQLDGRTFINCVFRGCDLVFSGGTSPTFENCTFERCSWEFRDAAERAIELIRAFAQGMGDDGLPWLESLFLQTVDSPGQR